MAILGTGSLRENQLTNTGFDIWSQSTLENVGSDMIYSTSGTAWTGGGNETAPSGYIFRSMSGNPALGYAANIVASGGQSGAYVSIVNTQNQLALEQSFTTVVGKLYRITFYHKDDTGTGSVKVTTGTYESGTQLYDSGYVSDGDWTQYTGVFEATTTTTYFSLKPAHSTTTLFDTVEIFEVTPGVITDNYDCADGWLTHDNSNLDVYREHDGANTKDGSFYSLKCVTSGETNVKYPGIYERTQQQWWGKFKGRTVAFGCWTKSSAASQTRLTIWYEGGSGGSAYAYSSYNTGTGWEWLEVTTTIAADIGDVSAGGLQVGILFGTNNGDQYISQPMFVFGSSIGEGNYTKPINEIIALEEHMDLDGFLAADIAGVSGGGATRYGSSHHIVNLEVASRGKLSKNIKMIDLSTVARDTGSAGGGASGFRWHTGNAGTGWNNYGCLLGGVTNNTFTYANTGLMPCTYDGDIWVYIYATGSGTFTSSGVSVNSVMLK